MIHQLKSAGWMECGAATYWSIISVQKKSLYLHVSEQNIDKEIKNINNWCNENNQLLNTEKTVSITIDPSKNRNLSECVYHSPTGNLKLLGNIFNKKITWQSHVITTQLIFYLLKLDEQASVLIFKDLRSNVNHMLHDLTL